MHTILPKNENNRLINIIPLPDYCVHISFSGSWQHGDVGVHNICDPKKKKKL